MREMHLRIFVVAVAATFLLATAHAQQSHWASADEKTAKYIIEMERKWAEGVCVDNGVVASLLADDFQGTSTKGVRFTKADELKDEEGARTAHDCGLDEAKVHFIGDTDAGNDAGNVDIFFVRRHDTVFRKSMRPRTSGSICEDSLPPQLARIEVVCAFRSSVSFAMPVSFGLLLDWRPSILEQSSPSRFRL